MARLFLIVALFVSLAASSQAFTAPSCVSRRTPTTTLMNDNSNNQQQGGPETFVERGVSVDQDGKSNVWAIEPKVEVQAKSSDQVTQSVLLASGGLVVAAVAAAGILTNLPDPNQF